MQKINLVIPDNMDYRTSEAYRTLRTNVLFCGEEINAIAVTSCTPGEGKSEVSFRLAESLAETDRKILYIDADLRRSVFSKRYQVTQEVKGLSHYLSGQEELGAVVCATNISNLHVILPGPVPPNPSELLGNEHFRQLMEKTHALYDYIIIDTPPLGSVIDAAVIAKECDGAMLVIENDAISYKMAQKVERQLERSGCRILGAVLNKVDVRAKGYYGKYYYSKYYGGDYSSAYYGDQEVEERKESTEE